MRYSIGIVIALAAVVLGVGFLVWRYEGQLNEARAEAEQLKRDRDMAKAQLKDLAGVAADSLGQTREGEVFPRPFLENVPELKGLADSLGFQSIHVFRWRGGTLEGWIQFQTEAEPMKHDLLQYAKDAKAMGGENYDPRAVSGAIVIAFKARKDEPDISDCVVGINQSVKQVDKNGVPTKTRSGATYKFSGAIDARKSGISTPPGSSSSYDYNFSNFALYFGTGKQLFGDKKYQVFELKLSPDPGK